ncbi:unnamed protein product [Meloidogyne enterolobii]|uniref:Uncharacterized protein n=1 Tax=Meloidogyne enterolobii TaxID=390850 RepID=A0ACB1AM55_MELEN
MYVLLVVAFGEYATGAHDLRGGRFLKIFNFKIKYYFLFFFINFALVVACYGGLVACYGGMVVLWWLAMVAWWCFGGLLWWHGSALVVEYGSGVPGSTPGSVRALLWWLLYMLFLVFYAARLVNLQIFK